MKALLVLIGLFSVYYLLYHTKIGEEIRDFIVNGLDDF
jgi:hypothetical protein